MKIFSKIVFFTLAIIMLGIGYFIGTFILLFIFGLIALISIFYVLTIIFNNIINISSKKYIKDLIKVIFGSLVSFVVFLIVWSLAKSFLLSLNIYLLLTLIWILTNICFSLTWVVLKQRELQQGAYNPKKKMYTIDQRSGNMYDVKILDILFIMIISFILTYIISRFYIFI